MAKQKKKRNKKYNGVDAAITQPTIIRVSAVNRSKLGQWLYDRRQFRRPALIALVIVVVLTLVIIGIVNLVAS